MYFCRGGGCGGSGGCNLLSPHSCRSQGSGWREREGEKRKTFFATPSAISQPPVSSPATPKFPLPLPPHQLCAVDAFQRLSSATERYGSVCRRAAFHCRCLGRREREREVGGGVRRGKRPWLFSWTRCVETVSPLDTHPRENSPFNAEHHLLQPPCVFSFFFLFPLLLQRVGVEQRV